VASLSYSGADHGTVKLQLVLERKNVCFSIDSDLISYVIYLYREHPDLDLGEHFALLVYKSFL